MKRTVISLCVGLMLALSLAGCSRDQAPNVTPTPTPNNNTNQGATTDDGDYNADKDGNVTDNGTAGDHDTTTDNKTDNDTCLLYTSFPDAAS